MRKPAPAMIVALLSLFVALGGVGVAATGGNFILGQSNSADKATLLSAPVVGGKALQLTNSEATNGASTALGLTVASGHAPFTVNSKAKVANLNADLLDDRDSTYFLPKTSKAADADKLDGLDSLSFTQGGGHVYTGHIEDVPVGGQGTLLTVSGSETITYQCENGFPIVTIKAPGLGFVIEPNGGDPYFAYGGTGWSGNGAVFVHMLASRPFVSVVKPRLLSDIVMAGGWDTGSSTCTFQAVVTSFF
jgi:hypothetical protein